MMLFILATRNPKKVEEIRYLLRLIGHDLISLDEYEKQQGQTFPEIEETADTFLGNAQLKAEGIYQYCQLPVIADDSGLVVPLLKGEPGIRSARYAQDTSGEEITYADNIAKLHRVLRSHSEYDQETPAYFITVVVAIIPSAEKGEYRFLAEEGRCQGKIIDESRGNNGFGYDPVFVPEENNPRGLTFAEMDEVSKNAISHRSKAVKGILGKIKSLSSTPIH